MNRKGLIRVAAALVAIGIIFNILTGPDGDSDEQSSERRLAPTIGDTISIRNFRVTLNSVLVTDTVETGNPFADLEPTPGNLYVIINATWENTDRESRRASSGDLAFQYEGVEYTVESTEFVLLDGWNIVLESLSPLENYTTNIVFKIPERSDMRLWWLPNYNASFYLGSGDRFVD